jgi:hypothetical protein
VNVLETFFILFETDAKKAEAEGTAAVQGLATATTAADLQIIASETAKTAAQLAGAAKVAAAQAVVAEAELGVVGAVEFRAAAEAAQSAARLAQSRAVIAATAAEAAGTNRAAEAAFSLGRGVGGLVRSFGGLIVAGVSLVSVMGQVRDSFAQINQLSEQADRLGFGENVEGLNAANQVLEDLGGNAEKAQRNLRRFADSISEAFGDAESMAGKALKGLGVDAADANGDLRDTEAVMLDIAGALEGVSKARGAAALTDLGLRDPSLRKLLMSGRENVSALFAAERGKGLITNEQARDVRQFKLAWDDAKDAVAGFFNTLAGNWAPNLTRFANRMETFVRWLREHSTLVQGFAIGATIALGTVVAFIWGAYIPAWTAAAAAVIAATWPILAIIAAVGAAIAVFALLWEDVQAFLSGQPSLLGELVKRYEGLRKVVEFIGAAFRWLSGVAGTSWAAISNAATWAFSQISRVAGPVLALIIDLVKLAYRINVTVWRGVLAIIQEVFAAVLPIVQPVLGALAKGIEWVGSIFASVARAIWGEWGAMFDRFVQRLQTVIGWVRTLMGFAETARAGLDRIIPGPRTAGASTAAPEAVARGQGQLAFASMSALAPMTSGALGGGRGPVSNRTDVQIDKVEVHTQATDADGMAKAASGALSSQLRRATSQFDDGVER